MVFPATPNRIRTWIQAATAWVNISSDVYQEDGIDISRGQSREGSSAAPSSCSLTLNNRAGKYSPRNPVSPYYGLIGRNTPIRVALLERETTDSFTRTVASGWGSTETGDIGVWKAGTLGTSASNFNVAAGVATHAMGAAGTSRFRTSGIDTYYGTDMEAAITFSLPFTTVTGGEVTMRMAVHAYSSGAGASVSWDYGNFAKVSIGTSGAVTLEIVSGNSPDTIAGPVSTGIVHASSQPLRLRVQQFGTMFHAKVWPAASAEPDAWTLYADMRLQETYNYTGIMVQSHVSAANTNATPIFSYDNFEWFTEGPRFVGEVASWPQKWDVTGRDARVPIEASGVTRRLGQGGGQGPTALESWIVAQQKTFLSLGNSFGGKAQGYWTLEEGSFSKEASPTVGDIPMVVVDDNGTTVVDGPNASFGSGSLLPWMNNGVSLKNGSGAQGLATPAGSVISSADFTDAWEVSFLFSASEGSEWLCEIETGNGTWMLGYSGTTDAFFVSAPNGGSTSFSHTVPFNTRDANLAQLRVKQNGADSTFTVNVTPFQAGGDGSVVYSSGSSGNYAAYTVAAVKRLSFSTFSVATAPTTFGHAAVFAVSSNAAATHTSMQGPARGWSGERAADRMIRLCLENNIELTLDDSGISFGVGTLKYLTYFYRTAQMGPQGPASLLTLLRDVEKADGGLLREARGHGGLHYTPLPSLYNKAVGTISYSGHELTPPFEPVEDDQLTRNSINAKRVYGSEVHVEKRTGPMSVLATAAGGVGRYDTSMQASLRTDTALLDWANWELHKGTVDEARFPNLTIDLANPYVAANATLRSTILGEAPSSVLSIAGTDALGIYDDPAVLVLGYNEHLSTFEHRFVEHCAPASVYGVWQLEDAAYGLLDSGTSTLAVAATSGATSLKVLTADPGDMWLTGVVSIPITIGGETMTATAINNESLANLDFESGVSPWTGVGGVLTQSSTQKHAGTFSGRVVPSGVDSQVYTYSENVPVAPSKPVTVSAWFRFTNTVTLNASVAVIWLDSTGAFISSATGTLASVTAATWTQLTQTYTAPATARFVQVAPYLGGTPVAGQIFYVDDVSFVGGPQTFTVTRSVNGVVKAQLAGSSVHTAAANAIAL